MSPAGPPASRPDHSRSNTDITLSILVLNWISRSRSHSGGNVSDRLGVEEMQELVEFVFALAHSIFTLFVSQYLRKRHVGTADCEALTLVDGPLQKTARLGCEAAHLPLVRQATCVRIVFGFPGPLGKSAKLANRSG